MKNKAIVAIMVTMLLVGMMFYVLPVKAQNVLKIGVIGPMGWWQFDGMKQGADLAADWINDPAGGDGIDIGGTKYTVQVFYANEHAADLRPDLGAAEMKSLIVDSKVDVILGGFRTESVFPMRDVAMDNKKIYFICGAATSELVDCGYGSPNAPPRDTPCGACVKCDYDTYKYLFRITPTNNTMLLQNFRGFINEYALPFKLAPLYGDPVKTAIMAEDLAWTVLLYKCLTGEYGPDWDLGPQADIVYKARTAYGTTNFATYLDEMIDKDVRLFVLIYSAPDSIALISQMALSGLKAIAVGIDVLSQSQDMWSLTGEGCEYETHQVATGMRTPNSIISEPYTTTEVWDLTYQRTGRFPIYTSWGVYDGIISLHDTLENKTGQLTKWIYPPFDTADANDLVPVFEATDRNGALARFKYTQFHDPFSTEYGSTWTEGYVRTLYAQWQAGRMEVVFPMDQEYSKTWALPPDMYPYPTDIDENAEVNTIDIGAVNLAFGSIPVAPHMVPNPRWQFAADVNGDDIIGGADATPVAFDIISVVDVPLPYCSETGHMHRP